MMRHSLCRRALQVLGLWLAGALPSVVQAQTAQITAQAGVGAQVAVTGQQNLTFGAGLFPGVARTISPRLSATAARFFLSGAGGDEVNITVNAPSQLTGPGPGLLIDTWRYCWANTNAQAGCTEAAFTTLPLVRFLAANGEMYVWIGATARPTASQLAGTYTGNIELVAAYTGN